MRTPSFDVKILVEKVRIIPLYVGIYGNWASPSCAILWKVTEQSLLCAGQRKGASKHGLYLTGLHVYVWCA